MADAGDGDGAVCEVEDWLPGGTEGAGLALDGGGDVWLAEEVEPTAGGGGRPGMDLIGGGRRGRSFTLEGRGGRGGSEELGFAVLVVSGLVWITGPFLRAGAGAGAGGGVAGLRLEGLGAVGGAVVVGLGWTGFGSGGVGEAPLGLGARFGALALRGEVSAAGLVGTPGRTLPTFTVWFAASCVSSLPAVSVCAPVTSTEGLGGRVGVLLSGCGAPTLALGATGGLGGGLGLAGGGVSLTDGVSLGGGGLGAGTGAERRGSVADGGFGDTEGLSESLQGGGATSGAV